ncbi:MAG: DUF4178 domain-containing protein [Planctomycetota bacterium]|nr:DUF4178 domain-containing protein [Planctomycetota bacterium]
MSVLPQATSKLFVGATGSLLNRHFEILGRVRYGYEAGYWDEWYLRFHDDEGTAWISEDESNFTLESFSDNESLAIDFDSARPGDSITIGQTVFHLDEKGTAVCEGAEGQLPFVVEPGEATPFLDLSTSDAFATVEFDGDEGMRVFRGRRLDPDELALDYTAEEMGVAVGGLAVERAADAGGKQRLVRDTERALSLNCYGCGAPLELPADATDTVTCQFCEATVDLSLQPVGCASCGANLSVHGGEQAKTMVCSHCHAQLELSQGRSTVLGSLVGRDRPKSPLKIGQTCNFRGQQYRLVGHLFYRQRDEGLTYVWHEYMLHNKEHGYRWLELENGHWNWVEELTDRPTNIRPMSARFKQKFRFRDRTWKVFEVSRGQTHVDWVEGELPWVAQVGDVISFMDAVSPPYVLSAEWTPNEMEWYQGEYISRDEIAKAFHMPAGKVSHPRGVSPNQPYLAGPFRRESAWVMGCFALIFLALTIWTFVRPARTTATIRVTPDMYKQEFLTDAFTIERGNALCLAKLQAPVDNNWVYLDIALIDDKDKALLDFSAEIAYYHGYEGGESWSEGSQKKSIPFRVTDPGTYRLLIQGQNGGNRDVVSITVYEGILLTRYFAIVFVVCLVWAAFEMVRRGLFEQRRWGDAGD